MYHGLVIIDKEEGYTSRDIDTIVKKRFSTRQVGHLGTLDPFATGLLIVGIGIGTKLFPYIDDSEKEYIAKLRLFSSTATLDKTSDITVTEEKRVISLEKIKNALKSMTGIQKQYPPIYSAKHVQGKRAYDLARAGKEVTLSPIEVNIKELEFISYDEKESLLSFRTVVSKGTYIRSLGRDIAEALGTIGYLEGLRRTRVGPITLDKAVTIEDLDEKNILPLLSLVPQYPQLEVKDKIKRQVFDGAPLMLRNHEEEYLAMVSDGVLMAIYRKNEDKYYIMKGFHYGN